jgi:hypothetical protein
VKRKCDEQDDTERIADTRDQTNHSKCRSLFRQVGVEVDDEVTSCGSENLSMACEQLEFRGVLTRRMEGSSSLPSPAALEGRGKRTCCP